MMMVVMSLEREDWNMVLVFVIYIASLPEWMEG